MCIHVLQAWYTRQMKQCYDVGCKQLASGGREIFVPEAEYDWTHCVILWTGRGISQKYSIICWRGILEVNACLVHRRDKMKWLYMTVEQRAEQCYSHCVCFCQNESYHICIYFSLVFIIPSQQRCRGYSNATTGTLLILGHGVKGQGQILHSACETLWARYRLQFLPICFITSHVHVSCWLLVITDDRRNPTDIGSRGHMSRLTLPPPPPCEGVPHFALSSLYFNAPWL